MDKLKDILPTVATPINKALLLTQVGLMLLATACGPQGPMTPTPTRAFVPNTSTPQEQLYCEILENNQSEPCRHLHDSLYELTGLRVVTCPTVEDGQATGCTD